MGSIFKKLESHLINPESNSIFVEIGSDRGEGSTSELDRLAGLHGTKLITVDVSTEAKQQLSAVLANTEFVVQSGSAWAKHYQGPTISCLYLDNFDYIWDTKDICSHKPTMDQMHEYNTHGQTMNNENCQLEHMKQMMFLYAHLTPNAVVMFDDTYLHNDCWIGKCGPAVVFLLAQDWNIVEKTTDTGIILKRI
jgi:hypothetical protein